MSDRFDPFASDDDVLTETIKQFKPKSQPKSDREAVARVAKQQGFQDRRPKEEKMPLRPLQFRLTVEEITTFNQQAMREFGNMHGGKIELFRKMMHEYMLKHG